MPGTTIGVLGANWRATVTPWGDVLPWGEPGGEAPEPLRWYVAADDRWHLPEQEASLRQIRIDGTPVVETRLRVPSGDAIQRVWATGDGITVMEIENDSAMPIAVALTRRDVLTSRPPADVPIDGIDLPVDSIVLPVGHRSSVRVGLAHDGRGAGGLPESLPPALQVARGWTTITERASRIVLADPAWADALVAARCEVALEGPVAPSDDPVAFVLGVGELVRMGDVAEPWVIDVVEATEALLRDHRRAEGLPWDVRAAVDAAARVLASVGESRGVTDLQSVLERSPAITSVSLSLPDGIRLVPWIEHHFARPDGRSSCALFPLGVPTPWLGASVEAYKIPASAVHTVSFAVRWHGERPAVLWEVEGPAGLHLTGGAADSTWSSDDPAGEGLLGVPPGAEPAPRPEPDDGPDEVASPSAPSDPPLDGDGISFS